LLNWPRVHAVEPILEVTVYNTQADWPAKRMTVTNASSDLGAIGLDLHATATTMAELAAGQIAINCVLLELETGRNALNDAGQTRAVALASGDHSKRHGRPLYAAITLQGLPR
jgi:hypothetical protein